MKKITTYFKNNINNTLWRYYAFVFLRDLSFFSAVLVPFFTDWGGISLTKVQILQSWFMFWIFLLEVPTGAVADYIGRKHSLALGSLVVTLAALIYGSLPKFETFLLGEFLFATAVALMSGADEALLYDALKETGREKESKKIFGRAHSIHLSGIFIAAPIGSYFASKFGFNAPMLLSAIPFFLAGIVAWTIKEPVVYQKKSESKRYFEIVKKGFRFFYNHKSLRLLAIDGIVVASGAYFVIWLYQPLLKSVGVPIFYFGFVHALLVAAEIMVSSNFELFEKIFGSAKALLRFSAAVTAGSFLVLTIFPNKVTIILFVILAGGFGLTRLQLISAYMNKFIPSSQRATVLSSISMFRRFSLVLLNPLMGWAADYSLNLALFLAGLLPLTIFLFSPIKQEMLEASVDKR